MPLTNVTPRTTARAVRARRTFRASTPLTVALHIRPIVAQGLRPPGIARVRPGLVGCASLSVQFNNAGTSTMHRIYEWPLEEWERVVSITSAGSSTTLHGSGVDGVLDRVESLMRGQVE